MFEWCMTPQSTVVQLYHGVSLGINQYYRYVLSWHRYNTRNRPWATRRGVPFANFEIELQTFDALTTLETVYQCLNARMWRQIKLNRFLKICLMSNSKKHKQFLFKPYPHTDAFVERKKKKHTKKIQKSRIVLG